MRIATGLGCTAALAAACLPATLAADERTDFFEAKIRPVLAEHCYGCHSAEAARSGRLKGGLQLDTREGTRAGGDSGPGVVPGDPDESLLLDALRHESVEMPPAGKLPEGVIADFERWIRDGAADPRDGAPAPDTPPLDLAAARQFWSLRPLAAPPPPAVCDAAWPLGEIDRFVLARLEERGLAPAPSADKPTLLRRVTFDLTGLPPTPEDLAAFLADDSPPAYERVVDRLLASPHFGERWGRHWLDLARYSESCGSTRNMAWHHTWRYRDYVIDALNRDLPYDRFVREQVAGDLLPAATPGERDRQLVAAGFLALGPKSFEEPKREVFRMDLADEQIDTLSRVFLGLSVACARCHDHRFDPIPTRDYYALAGILLSTDTLYGRGPMGIKGRHDSELQPIGPDAPALAGPAAEHLRQVQAATQQRNDARSDRYRVVRKVADLKRQIETPGADAAALRAEIDPLEAEVKDWDAKIARMQADLDSLIAAAPPQPAHAMSARDAAQPEDCRVHVRGETTNLGEAVPRGVLQVVPVEPAPISPGESGRRQLADWLADPRNPLTPRVAVNRVWRQLLGRGIVATPDDFGANGARPSHPELLDYLTSRFVADGWSVKRLVRRVVLSRTYRLGGDVIESNRQADPDNVWLWRMRPRRLEAEALRDAVLAVSGALDRAPPGGSAVAALDPLRQDEFNFALALTPEQAEHRRRGVYLPIVRGSLPESLRLFDFADPGRTVSERNVTIVPAQASYLMNGPGMIERARDAARRLLSEVPEDDERRLDRLFELSLARRPTPAERARMLEFLDRPGELLPPPGDTPAGAATPPDARLEAWTSLCQAVLASAEFQYLR